MKKVLLLFAVLMAIVHQPCSQKQVTGTPTGFTATQANSVASVSMMNSLSDNVPGC
ncbi:MAG: hypothetical protein J7623_04220 [Chitinophaga sp.]|uniref:hypothetical protein n=1 Tax=Chitinophaga sp. TaxID=1869181 RepID=UPI001B2AFE1A|nr:hypothetical protein [Chitinophaga sp.]MBO9727822.1 hypothetical protein [Chitinophaga sp.]